MTDQRWGALGEEIEPTWRPEREHQSRAAIDRRADGRRKLERVVAALAVLAASAGALIGFKGRAPSATAAPTTMAATRATSLPTGATTETAVPIATVTVTHLSPETILDPMPDHYGRGFALRAGGARFMAPHDAQHPLVVVAGDVTIEDLGTIFAVQYLAADKLVVTVEEGRVKVHAPGAEAEIGAGQRRAFAVLSPTAAMKKPARAPTESSSWRLLARSGRYDEAQAASKQAGSNAARDETADLLLAADTLRQNRRTPQVATAAHHLTYATNKQKGR